MNLNDDDEMGPTGQAPPTIFEQDNEAETSASDSGDEAHQTRQSGPPRRYHHSGSDSDSRTRGSQTWKKRIDGEGSLSPRKLQDASGSGKKRRRLSSSSESEDTDYDEHGSRHVSTDPRSPPNPVHRADLQPDPAQATISSSSFEPSSVLPPMAAAGYLSTDGSPPSERSASSPPFGGLVPPGPESESPDSHQPVEDGAAHPGGLDLPADPTSSAPEELDTSAVMEYGAVSPHIGETGARPDLASDSERIHEDGLSAAKMTLLRHASVDLNDSSEDLQEQAGRIYDDENGSQAETSVRLIADDAVTGALMTDPPAAPSSIEDDTAAVQPTTRDEALVQAGKSQTIAASVEEHPTIDLQGDVVMSSLIPADASVGVASSSQNNPAEQPHASSTVVPTDEPTLSAPASEPNVTSPVPQPGLPPATIADLPTRPVWNPADWVVDTASAAKARHANRVSKAVSSSPMPPETVPKAKAKKEKADKDKMVSRQEDGAGEAERVEMPGGKDKVKSKKEVKKVKGKPKSKVDDLKNGSKHRASSNSYDSPVGAASSPVQSSVPPSPSQNHEDTPDEDDNRVFCICRRPYGDEDEGTTMIACDNGCENWFHPACVGIDEDLCDLIDTYICPLCEPHTSLRTIIKRRCKREGCDNAVKQINSKFCSDLCGFKHAQVLVEGLGNKKVVSSLSNTFCYYPRPNHVRVVHHLPPSSPPSQGDGTPGDRLVAIINNQLQIAQRSLELVRKRQTLLRQVVARLAAQAVLVNVNGDDDGAGDEGEKPRKGKKDGKRQGGEDRPCGWDRRLVWGDDEVRRWDGVGGTDGGGGEDGLVCTLGKRRCDRHQGWQKTLAVAYEVEEAQLIRRKETLEVQKSEIKADMEMEAQGWKVKDGLAGRLKAANGSLVADES